MTTVALLRSLVPALVNRGMVSSMLWLIWQIPFLSEELLAVRFLGNLDRLSSRGL